jgi:hypothetical protein
MAKQTVHGKDALKRKDASVVKHGNGPAIPKLHWVKDVGESVFATGHGNDPAGAFLARPAKDRATPHKKINECDY